MSLTWHITAKDLRRLRIPVCLWAVLIAAQVILALELVRGAGFETGAISKAEYMPIFDLLRLLGHLLGFVIAVIGYCLMGHLVQGDQVAKGDAFWMTRPISGLRLLGSKLVTTVLVFGLLPIVIWVPFWIHCGYTVATIGWAALATAKLHLALVPLAFAMAALTNSLGRFELWSLVVMMAAVAIPSALKLFIARWTTCPVGPSELTALLFILTCSFVVGLLYRTRRFRLGLGVALLGSGLSLVSLLHPLNVKVATDEPVLAAAEPLHGGFPLALNADAHVVSSDSGNHLLVRLDCVFSPPPELTYWRLDRADLTWRSQDSALGPVNAPWSQPSDTLRGSFPLTQIGLPAGNTVRRTSPPFASLPETDKDGLILVQTLSSSVGSSLISHHPTLEGTLWFKTYRLQSLWEIPFRQGASATSRNERFRIVRTEVLPFKSRGKEVREHLFVMLARTRSAASTRFLSMDSFRQFVGLAPRIGDRDVWDLIDPDRTESHGIALDQTGELTCVLGTVLISWDVIFLQPPAASRDGQIMSRPFSWFDGASLVRLHPVEERTFSLEVPRTPVADRAKGAAHND